MDDFIRTVGEKSLSKLYDEATTLIARGPGMKHVIPLKNVLTAMDLVLGPLSEANMEYVRALKLISEELRKAMPIEGKRSIVDSSSLLYGILTDWFRELNAVIDDNNLLFSSSSVYQENDPDKWGGEDDDKTPL
ncbi:MAG: hypothetical protein M1162_00805 [Candidatus Thermoplasmatota archaeon]|nr:hypothetical protein [Candidatus Thermoplasmatota archaeon]